MLTAGLAALGLAGAAQAQVPFRISRPVNGATVRETVKIQIPRTSLSGVKYLALTVDGKFRAGVSVPAQTFTGKPVKTDTIYADASTVTLLWNTKAPVADPKNPSVLEGVEDGTHAIRVIAFGDGDRKLSEETLTLTVSNRGGLAMPGNGIGLSYAFRIGDQSLWRQTTTLEFLGERQAPPPGPLNQGGGSGYASRGAGQGGGFGGSMGGDMESGSGFGGRGGKMGGGMSSGPSMGGMSSGPSMGGRGGKMGGGMSGGPSMGGMSSGPSMGGIGGGLAMGGRGGMMGGGMMGGGLPASGPYTIPVQVVKATYERTIEDQLSGGTYFVRDKVREGTIVGASSAPVRLQDLYDFKSRYRSVLSSGKIESHVTPSSDKPGAYIALPIIDLGGARRRIGQTWITRAPILIEWATLDAPPMVTVTNTLESLEWQDGYKTARVKQTYNGTGEVPLFGGAGKMVGAKIKMTRTLWFAYNNGRVVRTETVTDVDGEAPSAILSSMVPQAGIGGGMGMAGMGMGGGKGGGMAGMSMGGGFGGGMGDPEGGGASMGGGFGGMQGQEDSKSPAKFRSTTVVTYASPVTATKKAAPKKR